MLRDVAISEDRNVIKKEAEKIIKRKDLTIKIQRVLNVNTKVIPVTKGAAGTLSKLFTQYLSNILGKNEMKQLQKKPYLALHTYLGKY